MTDLQIIYDLIRRSGLPEWPRTIPTPLPELPRREEEELEEEEMHLEYTRRQLEIYNQKDPTRLPRGYITKMKTGLYKHVPSTFEGVTMPKVQMRHLTKVTKTRMATICFQAAA